MSQPHDMHLGPLDELPNGITRPRRVVAHMCLSLHSDDEYTISTSETVRTCEENVNVERMKTLLKKEHLKHKSQGLKEKRVLKARLSKPVKSRSPAKPGPSSLKQSATSTTSSSNTDMSGCGPARTSVAPQARHRHSLDIQQLPMITVSSKSSRSRVAKKAAEDEDDDNDDGDDDDDEQVATSPFKVHTFMVQEEDKVVAQMSHILKNMQQTSLKRLAKAWIKGICPKKQAKYPYHNFKAIPGWWPRPEICPFTEPDHIKKGERLQLCLHLLRLRPAPGDLQKWNDGDNVPHMSYLRDGWTAFLRSVARLDILRDIGHSTTDHSEKRMRYLEQLYDIAEAEERYINGEVDGTMQCQWQERIEPLRRNPSTSKAVAGMKRTIAEIDSGSDTEAERPQSPTKKKQDAKIAECVPPKTESVSPTLHGGPVVMQMSAPAMSNNSTSSSALSAQSYHFDDGMQRHAAMYEYPALRGAPFAPCHDSFNSSFASFYQPSSTSSFVSEASSGPTVSTSMDMRNAFASLTFPFPKQEPAEHMAFSVLDVPHPSFAPTVPNSPTMLTSFHDTRAAPTIDTATRYMLSGPQPPPTVTELTPYMPSTPFDAPSHDGRMVMLSNSWMPGRSIMDSTHPMVEQMCAPAHADPRLVGYFEGVRTLANTPIQTSPIEQSPPHMHIQAPTVSFRPSQF